MYGDCERCERTGELDCNYNQDTGEELYLCDSCSATVNDVSDFTFEPLKDST